MALSDSDSDLSSLSSDLSEPDAEVTARLEAEFAAVKAKKPKSRGINRYFKPTPKDAKQASPEPPKRAPSPPHEFVLADNDAIAFIVMFRSRFSECFAASLPHYGPQDIERDVSAEVPGEGVERLLCALLTLCLNRKKPVERGHYGRALEEAVSEYRQKREWPREWLGVNPVSGSKTFTTMTAEERLILLRTLILWCLNGSELVSASIKGAYKQTRREDDKNQPKAVQPWFSDSWRRKYFLIEGQDDTHFRIYRNNDGKSVQTNVWFSVAGTIDEAKSLADKLETEMTGNQGKILAEKIRMAVPRWEAGEEKRRRKDYRAQVKARFSKPEPGFGLYEGRTRGKRLRYTFGEEEGDFESSSRPDSGRSTPFEGAEIKTSSGRTVKSRMGGMYGESMLTDQRRDVDRSRATGSEDTDGSRSAGRRTRNSTVSRDVRPRGRYADGLESESETDLDNVKSADEWDGNEDESDEEDEPVENSDESDDELMGGTEEDDGDDDNTQESLVVQLRYRKQPRGSSPGHAVNGMVNGHKPQLASSPLGQVQSVDQFSPVKSEPQKMAVRPVQWNGQMVQASAESHAHPPVQPITTPAPFSSLDAPTMAVSQVKPLQQAPKVDIPATASMILSNVELEKSGMDTS